MKILVLTTLFPNACTPNEGKFVFKAAAALKEFSEIKVIAPVFVTPFKTCKVPFQEIIEGLEVWHPRIYVLPVITRWMNGWLYFWSVRGLALKIKREWKPDLIESHFIYPDGFAAVKLGRVMNLPVIVTALGSDIHQLRKKSFKELMTRQVLKQAQQVVVVSEDLARRIQALTHGHVLAEVSYSGVDLPAAHESADLDVFETYGLSREKKLLLSVGHFIPLKNHLFLVEIIKSLPDDCQLVIIGSGPLREKYLKKIRTWGLEKKVKILGPFLPQQIKSWLKSADIVLHPSLHEGIPNVVLEAMSAGRAVIASCVGGIPEIIENGKTGLLLDPKDAAGWTSVINALLQNSGRREELGQAAQKWLLTSNRTWQSKAQKIFQIAQRVISLKAN